MNGPKAALQSVRGNVVGFVGQNPFGCLHPTIRIATMFHHVLLAHGRTASRKESLDHASSALLEVGIQDPSRVLRGYAHELSGGMAQRCVIAIATMLRPQLLIADEPTTALDPTVQIQILEVLEKLRSDQGTAVLIVTHDLGVVANYCDEAIVMKDGRVVESGDVTELFTRPTHPYTRELLQGALEGVSDNGASS